MLANNISMSKIHDRVDEVTTVSGHINEAN